MEPYEIIAHPLTLWWAPVGEAFPDVGTAPAGNWTKVGTSGNRNYSDDGVTVQHTQTINQIRTAGSTGPVKVSRQEEGLIVGVTMFDMTLEQYRLALNNNAISTVAGPPSYKEIDIYRNVDVADMALLVRGPSPEDDSLDLQFELPKVFVSGEPESVYQKGEPAGLLLEFTAIENPNAASESDRFGRIVTQTP